MVPSAGTDRSQESMLVRTTAATRALLSQHARFLETELENTVNSLSRIYNSRALLVLSALGFLYASSAIAMAQTKSTIGVDSGSMLTTKDARDQKHKTGPGMAKRGVVVDTEKKGDASRGRKITEDSSPRPVDRGIITGAGAGGGPHRR
jgi:hypothetical protein